MKNAIYIEGFNLEKYLSDGVERLVRDAIKATLKDSQDTAYILRATLKFAMIAVY